MNLNDDAILILQLRNSCTPYDGKSRARCSIGARYVCGATQIVDHTVYLATCIPNGANPDAANGDRIDLASEVQNAFATSGANDKPSGNDTDMDRAVLRYCLRRRRCELLGPHWPHLGAELGPFIPQHYGNRVDDAFLTMFFAINDCPSSNALGQSAMFGTEALARSGLRLGSFQPMLQSSQFDGVAFDPFSFQKDGLASAEVDVGRR